MDKNNLILALRTIRDCAPVEGTNALAFLMARHAGAVLGHGEAQEALSGLMSPPAAPAWPTSSEQVELSRWRDYAKKLEDVLMSFQDDFISAINAMLAVPPPGAPVKEVDHLGFYREGSERVLEVLTERPA